ncbi:MAG: EamA family transporter [Ruminococcaceae bacterium]|nr:EamA family transporter [Oscillospiraceae bacterium]
MKNKSFQNLAGAFLVAMAGILWGSIGIFIRPFSENLTSMQIVAARAALTTLIMFMFLLVFKRNLLKIKLRDIWCFIGTGLCSIVFFNYCYFRCMNMTSLSVAAVLLYTAPAIVMLISALVFKEKITVQKISALLLAMLGCALVNGIFTSKSLVSKEGILIGLGAGFGYALYSIFSRFALNKGYNSLTITFYTFLIATIFLIPITDWETMIPAVTTDINTFGIYILFALTSTVIPYILYTYGLQKLTPAKASIIASVEPVSATAVGFIFFNERPTLTSFFAMECILFSIILLAINKDKK